VLAAPLPAVKDAVGQVGNAVAGTVDKVGNAVQQTLGPLVGKLGPGPRRAAAPRSRGSDAMRLFDYLFGS
jgi:hypothetical protein